MNEIKQRHGCVSAWLWIVIICNFFMIFKNVMAIFAFYSLNEIWGSGLQAVFGWINILGCILLMRWNKLGFYVIVGSSVLSLIANNTLIEVAVSLYLSIFGVIIWWGILHIKKDGISAWKLMETDLDYSHSRNLYLFFSGVSIVVLVLTGISSFSNDFEKTSDVERNVFVINDNDGNVKKQTIADDIVWKKFNDNNGSCYVEAPKDYRYEQLNEKQIMGLMCSDNDPAIIVIRESRRELSQKGITSTKDYANVIVNITKKNEEASDFLKISEDRYGNDGYLVIFDMSVDGTKFRYHILAKRTKSYYYYCMVCCLQEYQEKLQPTMSHILASFRVVK